MTTTVALIALICIVFLGSGADKNSNICPYVGAAWGHIYLLALCSRNAVAFQNVLRLPLFPSASAFPSTTTPWSAPAVSGGGAIATMLFCSV